MRTLLSTALALAGLAAGAASVLAQQSAETKTTKPNNISTLTGCVTQSADSKKTFTLEDTALGQVYRLTGTNVREYAGKHVEVLGQPTRRLVVAGGLYPSANVAAQAGAIDPAKAAIAAQSGPTANDPKPVIEFKVRSVRLTPGDCPQE